MRHTGRVTAIMSVQSSVAYGHVGNSAATFPLMRVGVEVWPVLTVHFSNHTGYPSWRGPLLTPADVAEVVEGIETLGVLERCDAVLSGYQGAAEMGHTILDVVRKVKQHNPAAVYCCDPVMGDVGRGMYVRPGIPELMRDVVVPQADVATPNHFELDFLTGGEQSTTMEQVLAKADRLRESGPATVLVTSVVVQGQQPEELQLVAVDGTGAWSVTTPLLDRSFTGSGDLTSAMFLACLLAGDPLAEALATTAARVYGVLSVTAAAGESELQLVAAQDELVRPTHTFTATRLR
ncbi:pyridoxal kinase PdxY [Auraticoccus sp. F435]|uniref:pyridoxal kinase n=1 Tax=Auraticoccus cholistanensis TaxID=2656650 RepID=A0A6A9UX63_9ACTN|nr:pyridoxal kinase PdxY [Auraticoccus cholistanensis]MVA75837.1 pyridoxal kinase PdxY [Auraticoccus cholistanensis]